MQICHDRNYACSHFYTQKGNLSQDALVKEAWYLLHGRRYQAYILANSKIIKDVFDGAAPSLPSADCTALLQRGVEALVFRWCSNSRSYSPVVERVYCSSKVGSFYIYTKCEKYFVLVCNLLLSPYNIHIRSSPTCSRKKKSTQDNITCYNLHKWQFKRKANKLGSWQPKEIHMQLTTMGKRKGEDQGALLQDFDDMGKQKAFCLSGKVQTSFVQLC